MKRVFVPGAFWHGNRGDAALLEAFLGLLSERWPAAQFVMTSFRWKEDQGRYPAHVIPMIVRPDSLVQRVMGKAVSILPALAPLQSVVQLIGWLAVTAYLRPWAWLCRRAPRQARALAWNSLWLNARAILDSDQVIAVPGGYLNAYRWTDTYWLYHLPVIHLADHLGSPASLAPCTLGPFTGINWSIARRSLRHIDRVLLREELSVEMLRTNGFVLRHPPIVTYDVAFAFADPDTVQTDRNEIVSPILGVSVRDHNFPGAPNVLEARRKYLAGCAAAIHRLLDHDAAARVVITAQTTEDERISAELAKLIDSCRVEVRTNLRTPRELIDHYREMRMVLGTRMHANILAMCGGTPVVAIGYDPKTRGVMRSLGLEDQVLDIDRLETLGELTVTSWDTAPTDRERIRQRVAEASRRLSLALQVI